MNCTKQTNLSLKSRSKTILLFYKRWNGIFRLRFYKRSLLHNSNKTNKKCSTSSTRLKSKFVPDSFINMPTQNRIESPVSLNKMRILPLYCLYVHFFDCCYTYLPCSLYNILFKCTILHIPPTKFYEQFYTGLLITLIYI